MRTGEHDHDARAIVDDECVREAANENTPKVTVDLRIERGRGGRGERGVADRNEKRLAQSRLVLFVPRCGLRDLTFSGRNQHDAATLMGDHGARAELLATNASANAV